MTYHPKISFKAPECHVDALIDCTPGTLVVQIDKAVETSSGGIFLVDPEEDMPDVGTVVARGEKADDVPMPEIGARVLVLPKHGKSIMNFSSGGKVYRGFTRIYGHAGGFSPYMTSGDPAYQPVRVPWWVSVVAELNENEFNPYGDWVLLRHELTDKSEGGILLKGNLRDKRKSCKAEVLKIGARCKDIPSDWVGKRVVYHEGSSRHVLGLDESYVIVRQDGIYGMVHD